MTDTTNAPDVAPETAPAPNPTPQPTDATASAAAPTLPSVDNTGATPAPVAPTIEEIQAQQEAALLLTIQGSVISLQAALNNTIALLSQGKVADTYSCAEELRRLTSADDYTLSSLKSKIGL